MVNCITLILSTDVLHVPSLPGSWLAKNGSTRFLMGFQLMYWSISKWWCPSVNWVLPQYNRIRYSLKRHQPNWKSNNIILLLKWINGTDKLKGDALQIWDWKEVGGTCLHFISLQASSAVLGNLCQTPSLEVFRLFGDPQNCHLDIPLHFQVQLCQVASKSPGNMFTECEQILEEKTQTNPFQSLSFET